MLNLVLVLFWLPFALSFLFQDPLVQTQTARLATNILSDQLEYDIRIRRLKIGVSSGISLFDVSVKDHHDSTMIAVNELSARPRYRELGLLTLRFSRISIDSAVFRYGRDADETDFNLMQFISKFGSGENDTIAAASGSDFYLYSKSITLKNSVFHLFDQTKSYDNPGGMNYADMMFYDIDMNAREFKMINDSLNISIDSLSTIESCGLDIRKLSTQFSIARSGLVAENLKLDLPTSSLDLDLAFSTKSYRTFA